MIKKHIPVLVVGLLIVLVALAGGAVYGINKLIPSRKQMDLQHHPVSRRNRLQIRQTETCG